ncbi:hypothetical protein [Actinomadura fibrosa]|uniref:Lipoprotein n=1 Tax=Actinomadura fibrosa TaxID=111802 RepID=A0ABW2XCC2_9ACTN|nr:hypothetical protein [Actinomadura fibrosa]
MRMSATKLVGVLAIGGALLASTACGPIDTITGSGKKNTACKNIESELRSFSTSSGGSSTSPQRFSDTAAKIRSEGQSAGGDVEVAATKFAQDLDDTAATLRRLNSGNLGGGTPNFTEMQQHGNELGKACGYTGIRLGG